MEPDVDTALVLELEEKVTQRIRKEILKVLEGSEDITYMYLSSLTPIQLRGLLVERIAYQIVNNPTFVTEMAKKIGARMSSIAY